VKINLVRLQRLCSEISELESKICFAAQEELKPALQEVADIIRQFVPQVTMIKWNKKDCSFAIDKSDGFYNCKYLKFLLHYYYNAADEQIETLEELSTLLIELTSVTELAFGHNKCMRLDIVTGELIAEESNI